MNQFLVAVHTALFWGFIAVKLAGTSFTEWSWWWVLLPDLPWLGLIVQRVGL